MKTTFYMVRHGKTIFNDKRMVQGWSDSPLVQEGIDQAKALSQGLFSISFDLGVASRSERARDTLELIAQERFDITCDKGLKETSFGTLEGDPVATAFPDHFINPEGYAHCGGESMEQALSRFTSSLKQIAKAHEGKTILIVSHGNILCGFFRSLDEEFKKRKEYPGILVPNCSVSIVTYDNGQFQLESWPDTSYCD